MKNRTLYLTTMFLTTLHLASAQPYHYAMALHDYDKTLPESQIMYRYKIFRVNLRTGVAETLLTQIKGLSRIYCTNDQSKLLLFYGDRFNGGTICVAEPGNPITKQDSVFYNDGDLVFILDAYRINKIYMCFMHRLIEDSLYTYCFDRSTFKPIETTTEIIGGEGDFFLSRDQMYIYSHEVNGSGIFYEIFSTSTNKRIGRKRVGTIGDFKLGPTQYDARNGYSIIGFKEASGFVNQQYVVCDVDHGIAGMPFYFPFRSRPKLSADGKKIIIEEEPWISDEKGAQKTGRFWIFNSETNQLLQKVNVISGGTIITLEDFPDELFYYNPKVGQVFVINANAITPTPLLLDSLISQKHDLARSQLIGDANFVKELDNGLENAKKHLAKGDSVNCSKELTIFKEKVKLEYEKKSALGNKRFVTEEAYKQLYFNGQYIIDRLPKK